MQLIFFRHGPAGSKTEWQGPDGERPLTDDGRAVVGQAAGLLARSGISVDAVLTSPLARARQTAEIAAAVLGCADRLADDERLGHGLDRKRLAEIVAEHADAQVLMLVGHEPDFSATIAQITGGTVVVKKAGAARVDLDQQTMRGVLVGCCRPASLPRRGDVPTMEIEAKFSAPDGATLERLDELAGLAGFELGGREVADMTDTYLDTDERDLQAAGLVCRRRDRGDRVVITVKRRRPATAADDESGEAPDGPGTDAIHRRDEWETELPGELAGDARRRRGRPARPATG